MLPNGVRVLKRLALEEEGHFEGISGFHRTTATSGLDDREVGLNDLDAKREARGSLHEGQLVVTNIFTWGQDWSHSKESLRR